MCSVLLQWFLARVRRCGRYCRTSQGDSFDATQGSDYTEQPPSRADLLERRIYELEGEVGQVRRQLTWLLSKLDRVLVLPADDEEPARH
jgi:hypothetical protein